MGEPAIGLREARFSQSFLQTKEQQEHTVPETRETESQVLRDVLQICGPNKKKKLFYVKIMQANASNISLIFRKSNFYVEGLASSSLSLFYLVLDV